MISLLGVQPYEPPESSDDAPKSASYLSRKDLRNLGLGVLGLLLILSPVYFTMKRRSQKYNCGRNFQQIAHALDLYANLNDDRLPPVYATTDGLNPLMEDGRPFTWASLIEGDMSSRTNFTCPAASADENVSAQGNDRQKALIMSYGMIVAYGGILRSSVENPTQRVVIAETSDRGSQGTYDPLPFKGAGVSFPDGFAIGYDNSNEYPNKNTSRMTRLAFPGTASGNFTKDGETRHPGGIHMLMLDGATLLLTPERAMVRKNAQGQPTDLWAVPPSFNR